MFMICKLMIMTMTESYRNQRNILTLYRVMKYGQSLRFRYMNLRNVQINLPIIHSSIYDHRFYNYYIL